MHKYSSVAEKSLSSDLVALKIVPYSEIANLFYLMLRPVQLTLSSKEGNSLVVVVFILRRGKIDG